MKIKLDSTSIEIVKAFKMHLHTLTVTKEIYNQVITLDNQELAALKENCKKLTEIFEFCYFPTCLLYVTKLVSLEFSRNELKLLATLMNMYDY